MCTKGVKKEKNDDDRKETEKDNVWVQSKKGLTTKHVCEMEGTKENKNNNNKKHKELSCDEEKDEDEEH